MLQAQVGFAHEEPSRCESILENLSDSSQVSRLLESMQYYVEYWDARPISYDDPGSGLVSLFQMDPQVELMAKEESMIKDYLHGSPLNLAIRGHHDSAFNLEPMNALMSEMKKNLDATLPKLRSYSGLTFRGANLSQAEFDRLEKGQRWSDPGFLSSSVMYAKAQAFSLAKFSHLKSVVFVIGSIDGKVVPSKWYHRFEGEILFPRDTIFKILKIDESHQPPVIYMIQRPR